MVYFYNCLQKLFAVFATQQPTLVNSTETHGFATYSCQPLVKNPISLYFKTNAVMKTCLYFLLLLLFLSGCDKRCANFCGKWETEGYSAYINITRNGDSYFVTIQEKEGEPDWITRKHYVMYYKNGMLRSEFSGFKTIVYDSIKQAIRINDEKDEWKKVPSKSEL